MKKSSRRWRERQLAVQQRRCAYCDLRLKISKATIEHVIPRSWGGPNAGAFNRVLVCAPCNRFKSARENEVSTRFGLNQSQVWGYGITGRTLCAHLLDTLENHARDEGLQARLGERRVVFSRIRDWVRHSMEHPGWVEVVTHRYERFFGHPHPTKGTNNPLAFF